MLLLNVKFDFLPQKFTSTIDNLYDIVINTEMVADNVNNEQTIAKEIINAEMVDSKIFEAELADTEFIAHDLLNNEPNDSSDYILLSTLTDSALFESMDLWVPADTVIPTQEEISKVYSGLYSDTIVASMINTDIMIQGYGIEITEEVNLITLREQLIASLSSTRPDIAFDTSRIIDKENWEIPVIEFSTEYDERLTYSFIALLNVNGYFATLTLNSVEDPSEASQFFNTLLNNMVIK